MAAPTSGVCGPWIEPEDVLSCCSGITSPANATQLAKAITLATSLLFRFSGRQFPGVCTRTVRLCMGDNGGCGGPGWVWPSGGAWSSWDQAAGGGSFGFGSFPTLPYRLDGEWFNLSQGSCGGTCVVPTVDLPAPVGGITKIVIDGVVFPEFDATTGARNWGVQGFKQLARFDGNSWPCFDDRSRVSSAYADDVPPSVNDGSRDNTWQITYPYGRGPGEDGVVVTAAYACELTKWLCNAEDCELPQRVKSINREGVSLDFLDPMDFLQDGKTGVYIVDAWLASVNPDGSARRSTVSRLDGSRRRRPRGFT